MVRALVLVLVFVLVPLALVPACNGCDTRATDGERRRSPWTEHTRFVRAPEAFLAAGPQTTMSPTWRVPDDVARAEGDEQIAEAVLRHARKLRHDDGDKPRLFRRRTAEQILASGFATGCTDHALAALPLLRARGVPAVYVEAFRRDWLDGEAAFAGHVFVEALIQGEWRILNPAAGRVEPRYDEHVVVARGLDSWDIGLENGDDVNAAAQLALARHRRDAARRAR